MLLFLMMIVQIIFENLPVSSSGHGMLLSALAQKYQWCSTMLPSFAVEQIAVFNDAMQMVNATIFLLFFFPIWWQLIIKKPIQLNLLFDKSLWATNIFPVIIFGFCADAVTLLFWQANIAGYAQLPLAAGFLITLVALLSLQWSKENKAMNLWAPRNALLVGAVQGFALLPGISRFASTVATLCWCGYGQGNAVAISFLLQMPLLFAGSLLGLMHLHDPVILATMTSFSFVVAILITAVISYVVLDGVYYLALRKKLSIFAWYMVIPLALALLVR